ncbi:hypothetical protein N7539_002594 [Penicillium diatomitis]|uniref:Catalase core domain-containing protein n=1 Tax=Penicillium diatomitis TaxID=2819901 RepID=A0A9W9XF52_9EURO|nr:uncharacterized protein N7539_002594 [Penicillium diatomitis]KAJ5491027.1 hypothetical protein N7539_002594 [Penicillium diatomitis]
MAAHPLQAIGQAVGSMGIDPRPEQLSSLFQGANDGPAKTAARLTGVQGPGKRQDDASYFTSNEGIPLLLRTARRWEADFLKDVELKTPVLVRFSTVTLGCEFPDLARNPRGFAIKFYTGESNYDIVGLKFPVFFCRDPIQGPDVIHFRIETLRTSYSTTTRYSICSSPLLRGNHTGMMFFSDHGMPQGWTHNHGYGCHTFKWVNKDGKFVYIKYHFLAEHGQKQFTVDEATRLSGKNPDYFKRDIWRAIENGEEIT